MNTRAVQATDARAGKNMGVELQAVAGAGSGYWDVDNVRLTVAEPGPTTAGLLVLRTACLVLRRRATYRSK